MASNIIPKTFLIHAYSKDESINGFIRYMSYQTKEGDIEYKLVFVQKKTEGSKFLNFDSVKKKAYELIEEHGFRNMKIIDATNGKTYNVKENKKKQKAED